MNGYDALEITKRKQFDLVLCDINMPIMNGYDCAKKIISFYDKNSYLF